MDEYRELGIWAGDCEWCGEKGVTLICDDDLPEWTEGVACTKCHWNIMEEINRKARIDAQVRLDRLDEAASDAIDHGDFD